MTRVAFIKLLVAVLVAFILCLPEFFTSDRALTDTSCFPSYPCMGWMSPAPNGSQMLQGRDTAVGGFGLCVNISACVTLANSTPSTTECFLCQSKANLNSAPHSSSQSASSEEVHQHQLVFCCINCTARLDNPTAHPENPTAHPENPTAQPENQTAQLENRTAQLENQTAQPENPAAQPENQTAQLENRTAQLENQTAQPENQTAQLENPTAHPENPTAHPENPTAQLENRTAQLGNPTAQQNTSHTVPRPAHRCCILRTPRTNSSECKTYPLPMPGARWRSGRRAAWLALVLAVLFLVVGSVVFEVHRRSKGCREKAVILPVSISHTPQFPGRCLNAGWDPAEITPSETVDDVYFSAYRYRYKRSTLSPICEHEEAESLTAF